MKNLEKLIVRQIVYALIPLSDMGGRSANTVVSMPTPISLAGIK